MKFFKLFKKELREIITFQSLIGIVIAVAAFMLLGQVMSGIGEEMNEKLGSAVVCDQDQSALSKQSIKSLEDSGLKIYLIEGTNPKELIDKAFQYDEHICVAVIPKGFEDGITKGTVQEVQVISALKSFSMMGNTDTSAQMVVDSIKDSISVQLIQNGNANADVSFVKAPIKTSDVTVVGDKYSAVNSSMLSSFAMQQSFMIPIIIFILITFATQLNAAAIANEKNDKTLETLLSAPVSRLAVLSSKMCASGIFSLVMAGAYMVGFSSYMGGMMGGLGASEEMLDASGIAPALTTLGLKMGTMDYVLLGVQLFLTILIVLAISLILGALAKDIKSAQTLTAPVMFMAMIPYFITMFMDINQLPTVAKVIINAIPFTHTFTASANLLFDNTSALYLGIIYQIIVLIAVLFLAVRIFSTDKIFTMTLELKKKKKKVPAEG